MSKVRLGETYSRRETRGKWDGELPTTPCPALHQITVPQHVMAAIKKYGYTPRYYWCSLHGDWFELWQERERYTRDDEHVIDVDLMTFQCPKCIALNVNCIGMPIDEC